MRSHERHVDIPTKGVDMEGMEVERVYLAESVICQDAADITVAGHEPHEAAVPDFDLGKGLLLPQLGKLYRRLRP